MPLMDCCGLLDFKSKTVYQHLPVPRVSPESLKELTAINLKDFSLSLTSLSMKDYYWSGIWCVPDQERRDLGNASLRFR